MHVDTFNKILVWTSVFTIAIFLIDLTFFSSENNTEIENEYIEKQISKEVILENDLEENIDLEEDEKIEESTSPKEILEDIIKEQKINQEKMIIEESEIELKSAPIINTVYINEDFEERIDKDIKLSFYSVLKSEVFKTFYDEIKIDLNEEKSDIRWKMKSRSIIMYWVNDLWSMEFSSVFIHEFWHFIDLYFLKNFLNSDISQKFYEISWDWAKIIKWGQSTGDFVSGYSMTNKYEDFAETFTYYVLHNNDFVAKIKNSSVLEKKYDFFSNYIFKENSFLWTDFWWEEFIKDYYWDTTKIEINLKNFLKYIKI